MNSMNNGSSLPHHDPAAQDALRVSRRSFGVAAATAGAVAGVLADPIARMAHAAGSDRLKIGLVGCGGRGTGAASQAISADPGVVLWAVADAFADRAEAGASLLARTIEEKAKADATFTTRFDCPTERRFAGFDSYKRAIECCDVVLLASPPAFRPLHLKAAVEAGRQIFCEKPMAIDAAGLRSLRETVQVATEKHLSLVSGFCWRYAARERDVYKRIHDGAIGPVRSVYTTYNSSGFRGESPRKPDWSDMEYCLRNWPYYTWLSGDHLVEQAVHSVDRLAWAMNDEMPVSVNCTAGREVRPDAPKDNNIFDHFTAAFEYADGRRGFHMCRHFPGAASDNSDYIVGTKGTATVNGFQNMQQTVVDGVTWQSEVPKNDMYQQEHDELVASIRSGTPINDGVRMTNSTAMAIMARMSGYTGQPVTWQQLWESKENLSPEVWALSAAPPSSPIAVPGRTKLV
jgi:myo-inositol 2-dehydrogenase / D-chiro-inositol 1-dehydrogenase